MDSSAVMKLLVFRWIKSVQLIEHAMARHTQSINALNAEKHTRSYEDAPNSRRRHMMVSTENSGDAVGDVITNYHQQCDTYFQQKPNSKRKRKKRKRKCDHDKSLSSSNAKDCKRRKVASDCAHEQERTQQSAHFAADTQEASEVEKPYACHICDKKYTAKASLIEHIEVKHANKSRYQCQTCGNQFRCKSTLKDHARYHEDARPYACTHGGCKKTYKASRDLKAHISRVHNKEIRYTCKTCGKGYFNKTNCTKHVRTHTCERSFACQFCKKRFIRKYRKLTHEKKCRNTKSKL